MSNMFNGCAGLSSIELRNFNTSKVTDMSSMFEACNGLTELKLVRFDTSKVENMSNMFKDCTSLTNVDVTKLNTVAVRNMTSMFEGLVNVTGLDLSSFNTTSLVSSDNMFSGNTALRSILLGENFEKLTGANMFTGCSSLNAIITQNFDTPIELAENVGLKDLSAKIYVVDETARNAYKQAANYTTVFGEERIKTIMELLGENPASVNAGDTYVDAGVTVIGVTRENAKEYMQYGFVLDVFGLPMGTTIPGEKEVTYILKYGITQ